MKQLFSLIVVALFFVGCASQKELQLLQTTYSSCLNEQKLSSPAEFLGETAENLVATQQGAQLNLNFDVRTLCNAQLNLEIKHEDNQITIIVVNNVRERVECACVRKVSTSVSNLKSGNYEIFVKNSRGDLLTSLSNVYFK